MHLRSSIASLTLIALTMTASLVAQSVPAAIYTDPPHDAAHPASMTVLHIPTHGVEINGLLYAPAGAGPYPTLVICHGLPGNEKNLDLAQAVRRAGWNAVTFNYRGSWGSAGSFRFQQNPEDAAAVVAYLRKPENATRLGIDVRRMAIAGHSMGGWVAAETAAHDQGLLGAALISAADMGALGERARTVNLELMRDDMETLTGVTAESMVDELTAHAPEFRFSKISELLAHKPLLVLAADDGLAPGTDVLVEAVRRAGNRQVVSVHVATDHLWSDRRIYLETAILQWLETLKKEPRTEKGPR